MSHDLPSANRLALGKRLKNTLFFVIFLSLVPRFAFGESFSAREKTEKRCFSSFSSRLSHDLTQLYSNFAVENKNV